MGNRVYSVFFNADSEYRAPRNILSLWFHRRHWYAFEKIDSIIIQCIIVFENQQNILTCCIFVHHPFDLTLKIIFHFSFCHYWKIFKKFLLDNIGLNLKLTIQYQQFFQSKTIKFSASCIFYFIKRIRHLFSFRSSSNNLYDVMKCIDVLENIPSIRL